MSNIDCSSCNDLREYAPEFVQNGVTKKVANSLKNNTGLNPSLSALHTDCEDLNDANDCLIGRMDQELESHEVCDWKVFMHKFLPNLYETLKAIIASICGLWTNVEKIWCWLEHMTTNPTVKSIHVYEDDDPTKRPINGFRIADGVRMRSGLNTAPIQLRILGTSAYLTGSLAFEGDMPTDYTNGASVPWSYLQHGCAALTNINGDRWGKDGADCSVFVYEFQVKACEYGFKGLFGTFFLHENVSGDFDFRVYLFKKGDEVPPDYATGRTESGEYKPGHYTYNPTDDDMMLIQVRLVETRLPLGNETPNGVGVVITCPDSWNC